MDIFGKKTVSRDDLQAFHKFCKTENSKTLSK
jgi:hypothetical protein